MCCLKSHLLRLTRPGLSLTCNASRRCSETLFLKCLSNTFQKPQKGLCRSQNTFQTWKNQARTGAMIGRGLAFLPPNTGVQEHSIPHLPSSWLVMVVVTSGNNAVQYTYSETYNKQVFHQHTLLATVVELCTARALTGLLEPPSVGLWTREGLPIQVGRWVK